MKTLKPNSALTVGQKPRGPKITAKHTMVKETKERKRAHACQRCDSAFDSPSKRDLHVRTVHEQRRDHACPHCAAAFGTASSLTKHVRTVHEKLKDHACL